MELPNIFYNDFDVEKVPGEVPAGMIVPRLKISRSPNCCTKTPTCPPGMNGIPSTEDSNRSEHDEASIAGESSSSGSCFPD